MPKLTVEGYGTFDVPADKRLVLAIEQDAKVDIMHACGGNARCTTCRVEFVAGEPSAMTAAEKLVLGAKGLSGVRLSCHRPPPVPLSPVTWPSPSTPTCRSRGSSTSVSCRAIWARL